MGNWRLLSLLPHHKPELFLQLLSCEAEPSPSTRAGTARAAGVGHMGGLMVNPLESCGRSLAQVCVK